MRIAVVGVLAFVLIAGGYFALSRQAQKTDSTPAANKSDVEGNSAISQTETVKNAFTLEDIADFNTEEKCYTAINGEVYNLTPFISQHPGGKERIMSVCGIDGTEFFSAQHSGSQRPQVTLETLKIGTLSD